MIIPLIVVSIITWFGNKAIPAVFKQRQAREQQQIELAKDLCQNHNDCSVEKEYAEKGLKK